MNTERIKRALGLSLVDFIDELESTQDAARNIKLPPPYLVCAGRQTKGRGRMGRAWHSEDGGLYFTLVVERIVEDWAIPLVSAYYILDELSHIANNLNLKWPNDILSKGAKLAGVLAEGWRTENGALTGIGVGVNVNQEWLSDEFLMPATSLFLITGRVFDIEDILLRLGAATLEGFYDLKNQKFRGLYSRIKDILLVNRQKINYHNGKEIVPGILSDIDEFGNGVVETDDNKTIKLSLMHITGAL
ncbi:biotin--[acetyl-CoA-carboxylase] ligase [bacterium]|nr:biotin--[acetyl-CoA-carboxylase] ligase [bacterium]